MAKIVVGHDENGPIYSDSTQQTNTKVLSKVTPEEPGWFMPGSKSEALLRGIAQGGTFGLAPRISAAAGGLSNDGSTYGERLKQYLAADKAAQEAHPIITGVSNAVASAPSMIAAGAGSLPMQVAKQAGIGALGGIGNSDATDLQGIAKDAVTGAAISGATGAALPVLGKVGGEALDLMRGKADPRQIAEAAITYKNALRAPSAGVNPPTRAVQIQNDLKRTYDTVPIKNAQGLETDVRHASANAPPLTGTVAQARGDDTMREILYGNKGVANLSNLPTSSDDLQQIINAHNIRHAGEAARTVLGSAAGGAALGGGSAFIASGGDLDKTLGGAGAGAVTGGLGGGRYNAVRNTSKLRMPGESISGPVMGFPGTDLLGAANAEIGQAAAGDIKDKFGVVGNPFGRISNYLAQVSGNDNPQVQQAAEQAQAAIGDGTDDEAKRKAAMTLTGTPEGRAVGNSNSPTRIFEN